MRNEASDVILFSLKSMYGCHFSPSVPTYPRARLCPWFWQVRGVLPSVVSALWGVLVCSREDEEGKEGCQQQVYPPRPAPRLFTGCSLGQGRLSEWCQYPGGFVIAALRDYPNNICIKPLLFF